jgi:hypothetical protein
MQIQRGTNRIVLLVGKLAIKFPRIIFKLPHGRNDLRYMRNLFVAGMIANLTEYYAWLVFRESFLVPVYLSIGFVSIQKRDFGTRPTDEEAWNVLWSLPEAARMRIITMDGHHFEGKNFRKSSEGYRFIDYGDKCCYGGLSLSTFFAIHHKEIAQVLKEVKQ